MNLIAYLGSCKRDAKEKRFKDPLCDQSVDWERDLWDAENRGVFLRRFRVDFELLGRSGRRLAFPIGS